jgi:hypothetical protein
MGSATLTHPTVCCQRYFIFSKFVNNSLSFVNVGFLSFVQPGGVVLDGGWTIVPLLPPF